MCSAIRSNAERLFQSKAATTSFASQSLISLFSSNIFFPSNMKERQVTDLGSIRKSVNVLDIDISESINAKHSRLAKGSRCLARMSASIVVSSLVATIGAIWHSCYLAIYTFLYLQADPDKDRCYTNICKASDALLIDGSLAFCGTICPYLLYKNYFKVSQIAMALIAATLAFPILFGSFPQQVPRLFLQKDLRLPFYKSILLKNTYGLVGEKGKLLSWDKDDCEYTKFIEGHFGEIYVQQGLNFLSIVEQIKQQLPNGSSLRVYYPPTANSISSQLIGINFPNKNEYLTKLKNAETNLANVRSFLKLFLDMQENSALHYYFNVTSTIRIPKFPFNEKYCQSFFGTNTHSKPSSGKQAPPSQSAWQRALQKARAEIKNDGKGPNARYIAYKTRIFTESTAASLFDLKPGYTKSEVKRAYLKAALVFHPDKVSDAYKKEAEEIFKIYGTAHTILNR